MTMATKSVRWGSYYRTDSVIHRLDPRTKLVGLLIFIIGVFFADTFPLFALVYAFGFGVILLSHVPIGKVLKSIRGILVLLILTGILNMLFTPGDTILWHWGWLVITKEGVIKGGLMMLRLIALIAFSSILTLTTTPISLSDGVEHLLKPLRRFRFPVHEFAMMMTIALRFIPILMEEADKIMKAQRSRGGDLRTGSIAQRLKGIVAIMIPLFFNALKRADDLAVAMEARCYQGGEGRTSIRELHWAVRDTLAIFVVIAVVAVLAICRWVI